MPTDICKARNAQIEKWISKWIKPKNKYPITSSHPTSTKATTTTTTTITTTTLRRTSVEGSTSKAGYIRSEINILGIMIFTSILD